MRHFFRLLLPLIALAGSLAAAGCELDRWLPDSTHIGGGRGADDAEPSDVGKGPDTISIASFNIQVFGVSKLDKPEVMDVLARVIRRFDVLAIQEVRSADQSIVPDFVRQINADGSRFNFIIGERLGRTSSKEQYAYLYDTDRIEVLPRSVYTAYDRGDRLHREPLVASFRVRGTSNPRPFTFTLINIHTDPDEVETEMNALDDVFLAVQRDASGEDDVILLGDLNADEYHLGELGNLQGVFCAISGVPTNTRRTRTYDNLVFDRRATVEYTGRSGVLDLQRDYGLTLDGALEVSDHLPVWAVFRKQEGTDGRLAARPRSVETR